MKDKYYIFRDAPNGSIPTLNCEMKWALLMEYLEVLSLKGNRFFFCFILESRLGLVCFISNLKEDHLIRETSTYSKMSRLVLLILGHRLIKLKSSSRYCIPFLLLQCSSRSQRQKVRNTVPVSTPKSMSLLLHCIITVYVTLSEHTYSEEPSTYTQDQHPRVQIEMNQTKLQSGSRPGYCFSLFSLYFF